MRNLFLFLAAFGIVIGPLAAIAEEIPNHPGWSISSYESSDRLDGDGNPVQFFSLQPPGGRPAITIEAGVAASLRSGSVTPESVYGGSGEQSADDNTFDLGRPKPGGSSSHRFGFGGSGIVSGGVPSAPPPARAGAQAEVSGPSGPSAPAPDASGASQPHTPQRPLPMADKGGFAGTYEHDLIVHAVPDPRLAVNDHGGALDASGGTGNGGGHPGENPTGDGATNNNPSGGTPNTPVVNSTAQVSVYGDGVRCVGSDVDEQTRVSVTFSATAVTSASYVFKDCKPDSTPIDPAKVTVTSSSTIVVNGKSLHLEK